MWTAFYFEGTLLLKDYIVLTNMTIDELLSEQEYVGYKN